ncbi:MAG: MFS transporter, partial [Comamonas sp.]
VAAALAGSALALALAWRHLARAPAPLLSLAPLRVPTFAVTAVGGSLFRIAIGSAPFLLPLMFQLALGLSAVQAGLMMLALFAGNLLIKPLTTPMLRRWGFRRVLVGNGLLVAAGFLVCATFGPSTPPAWMALVLFVCGVNRSTQFTAINALGFADLPSTQMSDASTLSSMLHQMNAGLGIAFGALALALAGWLLGDAEGALSLAAFRGALVLAAALALLALLDALRLPADAGAQVSGHGQARSSR